MIFGTQFVSVRSQEVDKYVDDIIQVFKKVSVYI